MIKQIKDKILKLILGNEYVPEGLLELYKYFRHNDPIDFNVVFENGKFIAISNNFRHGSIVTSAKTKDKLDNAIIDAILTSFDIPSSYSNEAKIVKVGKKVKSYAVA